MAKGIYKDLTGLVFNRLTVLGRGEKLGNRLAYTCKCECGNTVNVLAQSLRKGATKSCGCLHKEAISNDLIGRVFNKWTVLRNSGKAASSGYRYWTCKCECGRLCDVSGDILLLGKSTRCVKCKGKFKEKQICINGHDTALWGRSSSYACRACIKNKHMQVHYGITLEEFIKLYEFQKGLCCVCKKELGPYLPKQSGWGKTARIEVDHDHKIKHKRSSVRGLLCGGRFAGCNRKLGHIDNVEWLENAAKYIANPPAQVFLNQEITGINGNEQTTKI